MKHRIAVAVSSYARKKFKHCACAYSKDSNFSWRITNREKGSQGLLNCSFTVDNLVSDVKQFFLE